MKKWICLLLALLMLGLTACDLDENTQTTASTEEKPQKVTLYVPKTITVTADGKSIALQVILETDWQNKESFTAQMRSEDAKESIGFNTVYENKKSTLDYGDGAQKIVSCYDDAGRVISQTVIFPENASVTKNETIITYDSRGRTVRQETRIYYADREEPVSQAVDFVFTETETGSKGVAVYEPVEQEMYYDANDRLIRTVTRTNGNEATRTENTYDENGNKVLSVTYVAGVETSKTETVYEAYEVTPEKAQQLPYFRQEKQ